MAKITLAQEVAYVRAGLGRLLDTLRVLDDAVHFEPSIAAIVACVKALDCQFELHTPKTDTSTTDVSTIGFDTTQDSGSCTKRATQSEIVEGLEKLAQKARDIGQVGWRIDLTTMGIVNFAPLDAKGMPQSPGGDKCIASDRDLQKILEPEPLFDKIKLGNQIGKGSFGKVYKATYGEAPVAVKVIEYTASSLESARNIRFEASLSVSLNHPNIVQSFQYASRDNLADPTSVEVWIMMELCKLGTLHMKVAAGAFRSEPTSLKSTPDVLKVVRTMHQIALGLGYLHSRGVVHGDLSSNNVLLSIDSERNGFVAKISDFGTARSLRQDEKRSTKSFGTAAFMPPEMFALTAPVLSSKVDTYSLGVLMWNVYTGRPPFAGKTAFQIMAQVSRGYQLTLLSSREGSKVPSKAEGLFRRLFEQCVERDPELRVSAKEAGEALGECANTWLAEQQVECQKGIINVEATDKEDVS